MPYKIIESKNIADIYLKIWTKTKRDLFNEIIFAFSDQIVDFNNIKKNIKEKISLKENNFPDLIFKFIEKLIYFKDTKRLVFKKTKIDFFKNQINGYLIGQKIDKNLPIKIDIKALAYHKFKIKKIKNFYFVYLVFDV